jgi:hypothetical protein
MSCKGFVTTSTGLSSNFWQSGSACKADAFSDVKIFADKKVVIYAFVCMQKNVFLEDAFQLCFVY